jgi:hypothetical protein
MRRPEQLCISIVETGCFGHGKVATEPGAADVGRKGGLMRGAATVRVDVRSAPVWPLSEQPATIITKSSAAIEDRIASSLAPERLAYTYRCRRMRLKAS